MKNYQRVIFSVITWAFIPVILFQVCMVNYWTYETRTWRSLMNNVHGHLISAAYADDIFEKGGELIDAVSFLQSTKPFHKMIGYNYYNSYTHSWMEIGYTPVSQADKEIYEYVDYLINIENYFLSMSYRNDLKRSPEFSENLSGRINNHLLDDNGQLIFPTAAFEQKINEKEFQCFQLAMGSLSLVFLSGAIGAIITVKRIKKEKNAPVNTTTT